MSGDLNVAQSHLLNWLIYNERERESELKRQDYEVMALAGNEGTNIALLKHLQKIEEPEEAEDFEWLTPKSEEDLQEIMEQLSRVSQSVPQS